jgi:transcriptional/translational regulatory protein YebC/TACO1
VLDSQVNLRLDAMIKMAEETGISLDKIVEAIGRADQTTFDAASESPSRLPMYIKSSDKP